MTAPARDNPAGHTAADTSGDHGLADYGYRPSLERSIGRFSSFAAGVSYISILTGTFQLFYFGFAFGGPTYWWSWPLVFFGQIMVALSFAELAGRYPIAGSVYNWSKRLGGQVVGWLAGWTMLVASIVTVGAVALAYQIMLPQIWDGFQLWGDGTGERDFAISAVIWGTILITFTTIINGFGVKLMARINSFGVAIELIAAVLLVILLGVNITNPPSVITDTTGYGDTNSAGYLGVFLVAALASAYVMYGFDTASSLGEETVDPKRTAPVAILRAIIASFVIGGLILLFAILSAPDLADPELASPSGGLPLLVTTVLGSTLGKVFLGCVVVAITVCCLAIHTAAVRLTFAMARDNVLPAGSVLAKVDPKRGTSVIPAIVVGVLAVLILVVNIGQPKIFTAVTSVAVIMIYLAYLLVTAPMLRRRLSGEWPDVDASQVGFSLGRWGLPVNIIAVVWGAGMALNLAWPREDIYGENYQWVAFVFIGGVCGLGLLWYLLIGRRQHGTLPEHAAQTSPTVTT